MVACNGAPPARGARSTDPPSEGAVPASCIGSPPSGPTPSTSRCRPSPDPGSDARCRSRAALPMLCGSDGTDIASLTALPITRPSSGAGSRNGRPERDVVVVCALARAPSLVVSTGCCRAATDTGVPAADWPSPANGPTTCSSAGAMTTAPGASRLASTARNGSSASTPDGKAGAADNGTDVTADVKVVRVSMHRAVATRVPSRGS